MRVIAFNGSPNAGGNTYLLLRTVLDVLEDKGATTELFHLGGEKVRGCIACFGCFQKKDGACSITDDCINECIGMMTAADAILIGSPTYFCNVSAPVKAMIDRAGLVAKANGEMFRRKVGAAVVAVRRAGSLPVFDAINHFFLIGQMIVPGSSYWNMGIGLQQGDVANDEEGMATMKTLGSNIAWLLDRIGD
jgi:multimeric flavodoxin WrbA